MQRHLLLVVALLLLSVAFPEVNSSDGTINAILKENRNIPFSKLKTKKDPEVDLNAEGIVKR